MRTKPGDMVTSAEIKDDLERLQARGDFEAIDVRNVEDERGAGLRMKFTEKRWGPNFFKFGLGLRQPRVTGEKRARKAAAPAAAVALTE